MKRIKKLLSVTLLTCCCAVCFSVPVSAQSLASTTVPVSAEAQISPRADVLEWRFKVENNKTYRRLYNVTEGRWVTDWELVG